jgi:peptidoglycan hydrolase CwlO-like protein
MKLKGKMLERLSPDKRERMERTLRRMEDVRRNDDMRVRELIIAKKDWAEKEKKKGFDIIAKLEQQIKDIKKQIITLDGCLLVLDDLDADIKKMDEDARLQREAEAKRAEEVAAQKAAEESVKKEVEPNKTRKRVTKKKSSE